MTSKRKPYGEGDIFAVPLRGSGFALGVVARVGRSGITLGYFFGPRLNCIPNSVEEGGFNSEVALKICLFGDLGLIQEKWKVLGRLSNWNRQSWPVPRFCRDGKLCVTYDESTLEEVRAERIPGGCAHLPVDGLEGAGYVEITLTKLLAPQPGSMA
ncbi:Imm26 family immunity protein [Nonomuraea sp. NPDC050478]|uniref:Imm26 family immunity protein n=1 Tax=Nonomuraea sp. NPDC050478 TaxID=3364365 RepID=UPI003788BF7E